MYFQFINAFFVLIFSMKDELLEVFTVNRDYALKYSHVWKYDSFLYELLLN